MESPKAELDAVGRTIREALEAETAPATQIRAARAALLHRITVRNASASRRPWLTRTRARPYFAMAAALAAGIGAVALWTWVRQPISFRASNEPGHLGDVIEAPEAAATTLRFSEGSSVSVAHGGRVRVVAAEPTGARLLLEKGTIDVAIVHRAMRGTHWLFEAGPFQVLVTGTKFSVSWDPQGNSFNTETREGSVVVSGGCLAGGKAVSAGERLDLTCGSRLARAENDTSPTEGGRETGADPSAAGAESAAAPNSDGPSPEPEPRAESQPATAARGAGAGAGAEGAGADASRAAASKRGGGWRELLAAGRLAEGLRAAERSDFDAVCQTATAAELVALADAARMSGDLGRATASLRTLRRRFARTSDAATAAFTLGRIAFDQRRAYGDAVRWFSAYLDEAPRGALRGDAIGRLMEARHRQGDRRGARGDAEQYRRRFPEGPYAAEAREILSE